jgi:hypothetical protein
MIAGPRAGYRGAGAAAATSAKWGVHIYDRYDRDRYDRHEPSGGGSPYYVAVILIQVAYYLHIMNTYHLGH